MGGGGEGSYLKFKPFHWQLLLSKPTRESALRDTVERQNIPRDAHSGGGGEGVGGGGGVGGSNRPRHQNGFQWLFIKYCSRYTGNGISQFQCWSFFNWLKQISNIIKLLVNIMLVNRFSNL